VTTIEHPRVTFALFAYNQQPFIEEAVAAALAQTYSPLEIIISDDCSTDRTFDLIEQRVRDYRGPHRIVLNRNPANLGIGSHVNKVVQQATGELILLAAGDDVSEINRTAEVVQYWLARNKTLDAIWSDVRLIDAHGNSVGIQRSPVSNDSIETQIRQMVPSLMGCSHATTRRLFLQYGPLREDITYEDRAFAFRALCSGGVGHIDKLLVRYRLHANAVSDGLRFSRTHLEATKRLQNHRLDLQRRRAVFLGYREDIKHIMVAANRVVLPPHLDGLLRDLLEDNAIEQRIQSDRLIDRLPGFCEGFFRFGLSAKCRARYVITLMSPRFWLYVSNTLIGIKRLLTHFFSIASENSKRNPH